MPVPLRETECGLPAALSVIESVPLRLPEMVGVRVTLMVQSAPGARVGPQLSVSAKFTLAAMLEILNVAVPELVRVTGRGWLFVPTTSSPKVKLLAESETLGDSLPTDPPPQALSPKETRSMDSKYLCKVLPLETKCARTQEGFTKIFSNSVIEFATFLLPGEEPIPRRLRVGLRP
jgi:hypothetical protein